MSLAKLTALARSELKQLNYPGKDWVIPQKGVLDVLVVGGGMCGQTATFALLREGVRNLRCVDRAPAGREGPWRTFARMDILRSPKHLTGPDLGVAALTYRAYHEAKFGVAHWKKLHKIDRVEWARYLLWVRKVVGLPVENNVEVERIEPSTSSVRVFFRRGKSIEARKVVLALGREGSGSARWPDFETFDPAKRGRNVFHSADPIDFSLLKNKRIGILGAGASAFDNAGETLEAGAKEVVMFARRPFLPQVNKSKWTAFPGFQHGYASLDDARRWRFYTYIFSEQVPPPYESVLRCERYKGFSVVFDCAWQDILPGKEGVSLKTSKGTKQFDAVIVCTGFDVNLMERREIAPFRDAVETWRSHVPPSEAQKHPEEARFPYLGSAFELVSKNNSSSDALRRVHVFNWGCTMSHGALAGDIPGLEIGARRLANGIVRDLFVEDADEHWKRVQAHNEDELKPTRYFVPLVDRGSD